MRKTVAATIILGLVASTALSQDVRNTYVGLASQIADAMVSNAKLANMANSTLKCRTTTGTGVPEDCTAAQAAAIVNLGNILGQPAFKVSRETSNFTITSGTVTKVEFNSTVLDTGSYWDGANFQYKPLVAGTYMFCTNVLPGGEFTLAADNAIALLSKNGRFGAGGVSLTQIVVATPTVTGDGTSLSGCTTTSMNGSTDTMEVDVLITAVTPTIRPSNGVSTFYGYRIGP